MMATAHDKENTAPSTSSDSLSKTTMSPSPRKMTRRGRSKSIGPGALEEDNDFKRAAKDRRKSAFVSTTKSILSKNEDAEKKARRKTMVNRRVSFAPEATLHTWDVIELARDQTTSTDSSDSTRRTSQFTRSSSSSSPAVGSDHSSPRREDEEEDAHLSSEQAKKRRRSSGIPPMNFNNPDDVSSGASSDVSEGESEEEDAMESGDDTGTAMSLDIDEETTLQSVTSSGGSTGSSARLEAALKQAAVTAGTRGIEFDEHGDMSMELVTEEVTNAFKPWAQRGANDPLGSAALDQENVNPFSPAFKASIHNGRPETIHEDDEEDDMSMDVTQAVGRIVKRRGEDLQSSPLGGDESMELTQAVGRITGQKRRRSASMTGSPAKETPKAAAKRRRSSLARSSMGDDTMDLTMAVGGIRSTESSQKAGRTRSSGRRRSSGVSSQASDETMEMTRAVGGIRHTQNLGDDDLEGDEDLSMELTTVLGGIKDEDSAANDAESLPATPKSTMSTTSSVGIKSPKDQERFRDTPDVQAKRLLTPLFEKAMGLSAEKRSPSRRSRSSASPSVSRRAQAPAIVDEPETPKQGSPPKAISLSTTPVRTPMEGVVDEYRLPPLEETLSPVKTPTHTPRRRHSKGTPGDSHHPLEMLHKTASRSPSRLEVRHSQATPSGLTPERSVSMENNSTLAKSIKTMSTPRKETLKSVTPRKQNVQLQSPGHATPVKDDATPIEPQAVQPSPVRRLNEELERLRKADQSLESVSLQDFLSKANIRFMDLTTTRGKMTTATTPSRAKKDQGYQESSTADDMNLESTVVAAACTVPELELYRHACRELKRYTKEGKQMISDLEAGTISNPPPLIQVYMNSAPARRVALDAQMRDMKANARMRSKEMWYAWRTRLLAELMPGLEKIGEGLIADNEVLGRSEEILEQVLPVLVEQQAALQQETERLEKSVFAVSEEEKAEVGIARDQLAMMNVELEEKRRLLTQLRGEVQEQDDIVEHLQETKSELTATIEEANRIRDACRGVSIDEVATLKESVQNLERTFGWEITAASSSPLTITMVYKSELQLFFHPAAFQTADAEGEDDRPNAPIGLTYIAESRAHGRKPLQTTCRFFLQMLRASLQALPQRTTQISDLLTCVSSGWDTATAVAEAERRVSIETLTDCRIVGDERLSIQASILLVPVETKVRASFELTAHVGADLQLRTATEPKVEVVYGEQYNEKNMTEFLKQQTRAGPGQWASGVQSLREKLIARGAKGTRK